MKTGNLFVAIAAITAFMAVQVAHAEETVTLSKMHLCCGACVKAVEGALEKVEGATAKVDAAAGKVVLTATDAKTARKAIAAIGRAGFHGESDNQKLKLPNNSGVKEGKVQRLELIGVHNCCGGCNKAIKEAIASVEGVSADTAKPKESTLVVEGDFDGLAVVHALNKAGFHVRAKDAAEGKKKAAAAKADVPAVGAARTAQ